MIEKMVDQGLVILELLILAEETQQILKIISTGDDGGNLYLLTGVCCVGEGLLGWILGVGVHWW